MAWWIWALVGFGFILAELVLPAFVLVWFGLGAFIVTLLTILVTDTSLTFQMTVWTLSSLVMVGLWFKFFKTSYHKSLAGRSSAEIVGEIGMITEPVAPFRNGKVRFQKPIVGSDQWSCNAEEEISSGTRVKVVKVDGNVVTVTRT